MPKEWRRGGDALIPGGWCMPLAGTTFSNIATATRGLALTKTCLNPIALVTSLEPDSIHSQHAALALEYKLQYLQCLLLLLTPSMSKIPLGMNGSSQRNRSMLGWHTSCSVSLENSGRGSWKCHTQTCARTDEGQRSTGKCTALNWHTWSYDMGNCSQTGQEEKQSEPSIL